MSDPHTPAPTYREVVAALAECEERYRVLVEGVRRYAIYMLDPAGIILTWNRGVEELLGYGREDYVGQSGTLCFTPEDRAAGVFARELAAARRLGEVMEDRLALHKDGRRFPVNDIVTALSNTAGTLLGFAKVTRERTSENSPAEALGAQLAHSNTDLAKTLSLLHVETEQRKGLEAALFSAIELERQRIGQDLHDDLCQQLGGISLTAEAAAAQLKRKKGAAAEARTVKNISRLATGAIASCRNIARGLHPVTLASEGLPAALEELAERIPLDVEFRWPHTKRIDLEPTVALHVYRIAEEAVSNAIKHAGAKRITIRLAARRTKAGEVTLALSIIDDGRGFDASLKSSGMGLGNMQYRAGAIGGMLTVESQPGKRGTRVSCTVPLTKAVAR